MKKFDAIMLVDDDDVFHIIFKKIIEKSEIANDIIFCMSAEEALKYLIDQASQNKKAPDLIFLDINMPGMNGWDFLEEFKKLDEKIKKAIIVVMLSSSVFSKDKEKALEYKEVADFLVKPFTVVKAQETAKKFSKETNP